MQQFNDKESYLLKELQDLPSPIFSESSQKKILQSLIKEQQKVRRWNKILTPFKLVSDLVGCLAMFFIVFITVRSNGGNVSKNSSNEQAASNNSPSNWIVRDTYKQSEKSFVLLNTDFVAGVPNKRMWVFNEHIDKFKGKKMTVKGVSKEKAEEVVLLKDHDMTILEAMNPNETRLPSSFGMPSSGLWRLDVYVDGHLYGDIVINVKENVNDWKVRNEYKVNDKVLFTVAHEPNLSAGKPAGYIFSFTAPFETFKGKTIAIFAYHKETGKKETVVPPKTITNPSPGYPSLNRFTANFILPLSGLWRYEVALNNQIYGDVVLSVNKPLVQSLSFDDIARIQLLSTGKDFPALRNASKQEIKKIIDIYNSGNEIVVYKGATPKGRIGITINLKDGQTITLFPATNGFLVFKGNEKFSIKQPKFHELLVSLKLIKNY